jgi:hypothetical protein
MRLGLVALCNRASVHICVFVCICVCLCVCACVCVSVQLDELSGFFENKVWR